MYLKTAVFRIRLWDELRVLTANNEEHEAERVAGN